VKDYRGAAIPTRVGKNNFDEIRYEYFGDPNALFDGFKADLYDFRIENSSRNWAVNYDFPAVAQGRVVREQFPLLNLGRMQAFVPNLRRARFADERVRRAMNLAFNFEDMNRTVFFGLYERIDSYFWGTELASAGLPDARELALLEPLRGKVPEGVFTARFANPINADDAAVRANLREAVGLMREAGYELRGGKLVSTADGQPFTIEFLTEASMGQLAQRFLVPYQQALERIGFTVTLRVVDDVQYETRKRNFDFDVLAIESWGQSLSPGNEQREYWGSAAADIPGSRNLLGLKDPAVDALIDAIIFAPDRETLVAATRALDRVLLAKNLVISQWGKNTLWTARYDRFSAPPVLPKYGAGGFPEVWWYDPAKAARISGG
jgi:microcin C transport system substrate-binding protein